MERRAAIGPLRDLHSANTLFRFTIIKWSFSLATQTERDATFCMVDREHLQRYSQTANRRKASQTVATSASEWRNFAVHASLRDPLMVAQ